MQVESQLSQDVAPVAAEPLAFVRERLVALGGSAGCLALRGEVVKRFPDFDERALGFADFLDLLDRCGFARSEWDGRVWRAVAGARAAAPARGGAPRPPARPRTPGPAAPRPGPAAPAPDPRPAPPSAAAPIGSPYRNAAASAEVYVGLLRKAGWPAVPFEEVKAVADALPEGTTALGRPALVEAAMARLGERLPRPVVNKAVQMLFRSGVLRRTGGEAGTAASWSRTAGVGEAELADRLDAALIVRLEALCAEWNVPRRREALAPLLAGPAEPERLARLLRAAADGGGIEADG